MRLQGMEPMDHVMQPFLCAPGVSLRPPRGIDLRNIYTPMSSSFFSTSTYTYITYTYTYIRTYLFWFWTVSEPEQTHAWTCACTCVLKCLAKLHLIPQRGSWESLCGCIGCLVSHTAAAPGPTRPPRSPAGDKYCLHRSTFHGPFPPPVLRPGEKWEPQVLFQGFSLYVHWGQGESTNKVLVHANAWALDLWNKLSRLSWNTMVQNEHLLLANGW